MEKKTVSKKMTKKASSSKREEFIDKLTEQLKKWDRELAEFEEKREKRFSELRETLAKRVENLKIKRNDLQKKLDRVGGVSEEAFRGIKKDIEKLWNDIKKSFKVMQKGLKK
ncbi:MAG: hypothetical protein PVI44_12655 [Balneolaceae bacterium]|jgi:malate synthase